MYISKCSSVIRSYILLLITSVISNGRCWEAFKWLPKLHPKFILSSFTHLHVITNQYDLFCLFLLLLKTSFVLFLINTMKFKVVWGSNYLFVAFPKCSCLVQIEGE